MFLGSKVVFLKVSNQNWSKAASWRHSLIAWQTMSPDCQLISSLFRLHNLLCSRRWDSRREISETLFAPPTQRVAESFTMKLNGQNRQNIIVFLVISGLQFLLGNWGKWLQVLNKHQRSSGLSVSYLSPNPAIRRYKSMCSKLCQTSWHLLQLTSFNGTCFFRTISSRSFANCESQVSQPTSDKTQPKNDSSQLFRFQQAASSLTSVHVWKMHSMHCIRSVQQNWIGKNLSGLKVTHR